MKGSATTRPDPWPWLFLALFLGSLGGLFLLQPRGLEIRVIHWSAYLPLGGCLLLPLLGAFADHQRFYRKAAALTAALLLPLFALQHFTDADFFSALWLLFFLIALLFQGSLLAAYSHQTRAFLAGSGGLALLGLASLALMTRTFIHQSPGFLSLIFWVSLLTALIFLALFASSLREASHGAPAPSKSEISPSPTLFFSRGQFAEAQGALLLIWLLVLAVTATLLFLSSRFQQMPLWYSPGSQVYFSLLACGLGAFLCRGWTTAHGPKRGLTLALLLLSLCILGCFISRTMASASLSSLGLFFFLGATAVSATCLYLARIPSGSAGLCLGFLLLACLLGGALGTLWHHHRGNASPWIYFWLFPLAALALQTLSRNDSRAMEGAGAEEIPRGLEWSRAANRLSGRAKPGIFSKLTQMLAKVLVEIFYARIQVHGGERLKLEGAAIVVANHPNSFLDPLLITAAHPARLTYWSSAKGSRKPIISSILERMSATNPSRTTEVPDEDPSRQKAIKWGIRELEQSAHLLIFPEGSSEIGLSLKPLKYGAARLGLAAAQAMEWRETIPIIPMAIDFEEPKFIRGNVTIRFGETHWPEHYRERFESDPDGAVRELTDRLTDHFAVSLPHLDGEQRELLAQKVRNLYGESAAHILGVTGEEQIQARIRESIDQYHRMDPDTILLFSRRMEAYASGVERLATPENHPPIPFGHLWRQLTQIFSFASYGLFLNWPPYRLTARLVEWFTDVPVWRAAVKLSFGLLVFTTYYGILGFLVHRLLGPFFAALLLLSLPLSGLLALGSLDRFAFRFRQLKTLWQAFWTQDTNHDIESMKLSLIQDLERFRESYAFYQHKGD